MEKHSKTVGGTDEASSSSSSSPSLFLVSGWRDRLCRCAACSGRYAEARLEFLLDPEDTVHHYEEKSRDGTGE